MTKKKSPRRMKSFEADADVAEMLDKAAKAGATLTSFMNEAVRKQGPGVLRELAETLRKTADELDKSASSDKRS